MPETSRIGNHMCSFVDLSIYFAGSQTSQLRNGIRFTSSTDMYTILQRVIGTKKSSQATGFVDLRPSQAGTTSVMEAHPLQKKIRT